MEEEDVGMDNDGLEEGEGLARGETSEGGEALKGEKVLEGSGCSSIAFLFFERCVLYLFYALTIKD